MQNTCKDHSGNFVVNFQVFPFMIVTEATMRNWRCSWTTFEKFLKNSFSEKYFFCKNVFLIYYTGLVYFVNTTTVLAEFFFLFVYTFIGAFHDFILNFSFNQGAIYRNQKR